MASLEIKGTRAFSLFDQRVVNIEPPEKTNSFMLYTFFFLREDTLIFKDLHSYHPLPTKETNPTVVEKRLQFMKQVISKAVEHMVSQQ